MSHQPHEDNNMYDKESCSRDAGRGSQKAISAGPQISITNIAIYRFGGHILIDEDGFTREATKEEIRQYLRSAGVDV